MHRPARTVLAALGLAAAGFAAHAAAPDTEAVEYYNVGTGHYFTTANAAEAVGIDAGAAGPGWVRTGRSFQAWLTQAGAPPNAQPVCRFYSPMANSHFYTASAPECDGLRAMEAQERAATGTVKGWGYEGTAFYIQVPAGGQCPAGTTAITRLYNNGFATGAGSNHRFVDESALQDLMVDRRWIAEGTAFCAPAKSTGTNADLRPTATNFADLAGTWTGSASWSVETSSAESHVAHDLSLTIAADGTVTGSGYGCSFTGTVAQGDGFRAFFVGTASASGCTDTAFNGDYPKLRLERFDGNTLMVRLQREDGTTETAIEARLTNGDATPPPASGFDAVSGDWTGTVSWVATQSLSSGNILQPAASNLPLSLSISPTGTVTGSGNGCTVTGTLSGSPGESQTVFTGELTLAGCTQAVFNGTYPKAHIVRAGPGRIAVSLEQETQDAQSRTQVEIEGTLQSGTATRGPSPQLPAGTPDSAITGAWQGNVSFLAVQHADHGATATIAAAKSALQFTLAADGTFSGTGYGCTFSGSVTLVDNGAAASGGSITASGCTVDAFNGTYTHVQLAREDSGTLEVELEREDTSTGAEVTARISGAVSPAAS